MAGVLGIAASPRKGGNSDLLLDSFLKGAGASGNELEKIYICDLNILACDEGNSCRETGACRTKDDMQGLYNKLIGADCLVVSTPVFFMGVPAQLKAMIDRCQVFWAKRFLLKRRLRYDDKKRFGFLLGVSGLDDKRAFIGVKETIKAFFYVLDFKYRKELFFSGVDKSGDINSKAGALEKAHKAGREL